MKILVFSDTHRSISECVDIILSTDDVGGVIHAGDHADDAQELSYIFEDIPFYTVSGNNDISLRAPMQRVVTLEGKTIFIAHGHMLGVRQGVERLSSVAKGYGAELAVFGHTHQSCDQYVNGVHVLNPGSMGYYPKTYGIINIINGEIFTKIINYN